jgi:hypothetical protein
MSLSRIEFIAPAGSRTRRALRRFPGAEGFRAMWRITSRFELCFFDVAYHFLITVKRRIFSLQSRPSPVRLSLWVPSG